MDTIPPLEPKRRFLKANTTNTTKGKSFETVATQFITAARASAQAQNASNRLQTPTEVPVEEGHSTTGALDGTAFEPSAIIIDKAAAAASRKRKNELVDYTKKYNLMFDRANQITYREKNPDCELTYDLADPNILYIKSIICEKKEGEKGGQGKLLALDTINMLRDEEHQYFRLVKLLPVAGLGANKRLSSEAEAEVDEDDAELGADKRLRPEAEVDENEAEVDENDAELKKLRLNYIETWGLNELQKDGTLTGSVENVRTTLEIFKNTHNLGGSRRHRSKKTIRRKRMQRKTKRKQSGNKRRQTKKRGKR
jgi:hypothetical protein